MREMFYLSRKLTTVDASSFNTSKVTNMSNMFNGCTKLASLNMSRATFENVTTYSSMFGSVPTNIIIVSNSIYDKKQKHFNLISQNLGLTILEHKMPKPFIKKEIINYFNINHKETHKVAIIGDRLLVDVLTAKTNRLYATVIGKPIRRSNAGNNKKVSQ